jgi:uroporphyrin-III C-methyltransferase/precorrin-2 dehydrogenase/sirohydrochlorin ferrochelatase
MQALPIFLKLAGKRVVVAGGGTAAARKSEMALRNGAIVDVYAEELGEDFRSIETDPNLRHHARAVERADMDGAVLAWCAAEDDTADRRAHAFASEAGVTVNVADRPELCDFTMASILDRSPLVVAIGTEGASPILGRMLKAKLETEIPASYGRLAQFVGERREALEKVTKSSPERRRFWERLLEGPIAEMILAGQEGAAEKAFDAEIVALAAGTSKANPGEVYLVGAGPGDPDLLTFRALRLMQRADVVLYDRLVSDDIINLVRRDAERIYVGKQRANHTVPQEEISAMLVRLAKEGKRVLRIKGGDPFIFGRGGEEIEMLADHGVPFQVVPGVTAASGCSAYAGIPLTHRDHAQSCLFVTAHGRDGQIEADWEAILRPNQTVAIYMGLALLDSLMKAFLERGASPDLPAAVVDNGTRANQRVVTGTIATLAEKARAAELRGPTIIIVGTVVALHDRLDWFTGRQPMPAPGSAS